MTIKEIVENFWRDFEIVAFKAVKNFLPKDITISETLTQAIKDGGYDGEFILMARDDAAFRVVFEAKLRSDTKAALPLTDFAKALVIAVVRQVDMIYVVTNLRFSAGTMSILEDYARSVPLEIQLLNGYSVKEFVRLHGDVLADVDIELKKFLLSQNNVPDAQSVSSGTAFWEEYAVPSDPVRAAEYAKQARIFDKGWGILLVKGNIGSGKSHYIEGLYRAMKREHRPACLIDLSGCNTYKDLFLEIMEKTLGLSLSLVDLLDEESFAASFARIGVSDADEDEIRMLKYLFSRETEYPFDYSFLFEKIVGFYNKIFQMAKRRVIVSFLNLVYAQKEVLQLLLYFLKSDAFSCVLEIADDDFWEKEVEQWATVKQTLVRRASFPPHTIEDWTVPMAKRFLKDHTKGLSETQIGSLVRKFGQTPAVLSSLVELIHYSDLYVHTPTELVYREICALEPSKNGPLHEKCLEYMRYANSDIAYIYAFVFLLCGEVKHNLLERFLGDGERFRKSMGILRRSHIFKVSGQCISIENQKIEECFHAYCIANLYAPTVSPVARFIEGNLDQIHLSTENMLEMQSRAAYYEDTAKCVELLAALGDGYLKMEQSALAEKRYRTAYELETDYPALRVSILSRLRIRLGLAASLIWKIGECRDEIADCLDSAGEIVATLAADAEREQLLLTLRYYRIAYQFHHAQDERESALHYARQGVRWIEENNLQTIALEECGKMWRFYAIAVKEDTQDISECLNAFEQGRQRFVGSAKFLFGYIIHKNMTVDAVPVKRRLHIKLDNYKELYPLDKRLSVDEYLHYRTNVAALHFLRKEYETAWMEYQGLLEKSVIFNIAREEVRILNDMANICWIRDKLEEARKKYVAGRERAKVSGCVTNYWPLLVNLTSFEAQRGNPVHALELSKELQPHLLRICSDMSSEKSSFERREYCGAALAIQLKNLWGLYREYGGQWLLDSMKELLEKSNVFKREQIKGEYNIEDTVLRLEPKGTLFDHNGLYLLKD